jgi:hypothetical protein
MIQMPRSATIDVAFAIDVHAIGDAGLVAPQVGEDPIDLLRQDAVGQQVEGSDVAAPGVVNGEHVFARFRAPTGQALPAIVRAAREEDLRAWGQTSWRSIPVGPCRVCQSVRLR